MNIVRACLTTAWILAIAGSCGGDGASRDVVDATLDRDGASEVVDAVIADSASDTSAVDVKTDSDDVTPDIADANFPDTDIADTNIADADLADTDIAVPEPATCATLAAPDPDPAPLPSDILCADESASACASDEVFTPILDENFTGSGEPGLVGDGYRVDPDDWDAGGSNEREGGELDASVEGAFRVGGPSNGCVIAVDDGAYLAFSTNKIVAYGYGADAADLVSGTVYLTGLPPRSWDALADGAWHHVAVTIDARTGRSRFYLDGVTSPELETTTGPIAGLAALDGFTGVGLGCPGWSLDEVRIYDRALPSSLIAEHAAAVLAGEPYPDRSACGPAPCAPTTSIATYDPREYPPADADTGLPLQDALAQLASYPRPRYREGHTLRRLEGWIQPLWLSADNDLKPDGNVAGSRATRLAYTLASDWHYYLDLSHLGCNGLDYPDCGDEARAFVTAHPDIATSWQTYAAGADVSTGLAAEGRPACPVGLNPLWSGTAFHDAAVAYNSYWLELPKDILGRPVDLIVEDGETWWEGRQWGGPPLGADDIAACGDVDPEVPAAFQRDYLDQGLAPSDAARQMWTDAVTRWRLAYNDGLRELNASAGGGATPINWYGMDGFYAWNAGDWWLGARDAEMEVPAQAFGGTTQRMSGLDFYPAYWSFDDSVGPRHGIDWVASAHGNEAASGDHLFFPFVAAGWSSETQNIRPGMWLGLLKVLAAWGAESYHPGYFAYPPSHPGGDWVWQAAIPAYAQAITSRWETLLRSSVVVDSGQRNNPRHVVVIRQELAADATPVKRWLVAGNVNRWENTADTLHGKDAIEDVVIDGEHVRVPIRMQGSVYVYDKTDAAAATWTQLDAWHEWTHPSHWSEDFAFAAAVNDGASGWRTVTSWPDAAGNATDGLPVRDAEHAVTELVADAAAVRPGGAATATARYAFEPRRDGAFVPWLALRSDGAAEVVVRVRVGDVISERTLTLARAHARAWLRVGDATPLAVPAGAAMIEIELRAGAVAIEGLRLVREGSATTCTP